MSFWASLGFGTGRFQHAFAFVVLVVRVGTVAVSNVSFFANQSKKRVAHANFAVLLVSEQRTFAGFQALRLVHAASGFILEVIRRTITGRFFDRLAFEFEGFVACAVVASCLERLESVALRNFTERLFNAFTVATNVEVFGAVTLGDALVHARQPTGSANAAFSRLFERFGILTTFLLAFNVFHAMTAVVLVHTRWAVTSSYLGVSTNQFTLLAQTFPTVGLVFLGQFALWRVLAVVLVYAVAILVFVLVFWAVAFSDSLVQAN